MKIILTLLTLLAICGCSKSSLTSSWPESLTEKLPNEALRYVEEKYALFEAKPLQENSEHFTFRILGYGGIGGHAYLTEVRELDEGTAVVSYRYHDLRKITIERKEYTLLSGLEFRLKLSTIPDWPALWKGSEERISDGMSYVIETISKGKHHIAIRSSHATFGSEPDTEFLALLDGLREFEK